MEKDNVALLQLSSGADPQANLWQIEQQLKSLPAGIQLVVTPENALLFADTDAYRQHAEQHDDGPLQQSIRQLAIRYGVWFLLGSFPLYSRETAKELTSSSLLFSAQGELIARYDKLHLFDVEVADGHQCYRESDLYQAGKNSVVVDTPVGKVGLAICYDLRFSGLFQSLREQGAEIILLPAAFTYVTGMAHWEVLLRARAIETQSFVLAAAQVGQHTGKRRTWGHTMALDPWGRMLAENADEVMPLTLCIDRSMLQGIRTRMPIEQHNRFSTTLENC